MNDLANRIETWRDRLSLMKVSTLVDVTPADAGELHKLLTDVAAAFVVGAQPAPEKKKATRGK